jgi:aspartyl-tRNA synthetase
VGSTLIAEGIKDIWSAIKLAYNGGAFDWEGYFTEKRISAAMLILQVGGRALMDKVWGCAASASGTAATATSTGVITKEAATEVAKELTLQSAIETIKPIAIQTITQIGVQEASMWAARKIVDSFSDEMHDRLRSKVGHKLKEAIVKEQLEACWIVDFFEGNEAHQQWVLRR